jgi:cytochrome P450
MDSDFLPDPPAKPAFDADRALWTLSRYADVAAALRETALYQASASGETFPTGEDETARSQTFMQVRAELARITAGQLRPQMLAAAKEVIRKAVQAGRADLLADIAHPWSVNLLMNLGGGDPPLAKTVSDLSVSLLYKSAKKHNITLEGHLLAQMTEGDPEARLDEFLDRKELLVSKSMFLAVSTTLPSFLAKSWLALLRNPDQAARLLAEPQWMPNAIEELLRYSGIVHTLHRKAIRDIRLGDTLICEGQMVLLKVASANFDPAHFDDPTRLDIARQPAGQFALGAGLHACVGAALVREASAALTPLLLAANPLLEPEQSITWMGDTTLKWPISVLVRIKKDCP